MPTTVGNHTIDTQPWHFLVLFAAAFLGGTVNAVAGGGILLAFPALLWLGVPAVSANATSTVALWPAALSSLWGYRREMTGAGPWLVRFGGISMLGGLVGARLLLDTPHAAFEALAPFLILAATLLFMLQAPLTRRLRARSPSGAPSLPHSPPAPRVPAPSLPHLVIGLLFQFGVAVYGGYFGAGIGILMLTALAFMGMTQIHQMNGIKNFAAMCINGVAAGAFLFGGVVNTPLALLMAAGAVLGGYTGAGAARRLGPAIVRRLIIAIGLSLSFSLLFRLH
jgi:uncharacterized protein